MCCCRGQGQDYRRVVMIWGWKLKQSQLIATREVKSGTAAAVGKRQEATVECGPKGRERGLRSCAHSALRCRCCGQRGHGQGAVEVRSEAVDDLEVEGMRIGGGLHAIMF